MKTTTPRPSREIVTLFALFALGIFQQGWAATPADLVPQNITVAPDPGTVGGSVTVSYKVANQGGTDAPASHTKVQIKNASAVLLRETTFATAAVGANSSVNEDRVM